MLSCTEVLRLNERLRREHLALRARLQGKGVPVAPSFSPPSLAAIAASHGMPAGALQACPPYGDPMQQPLLRPAAGANTMETRVRRT